MERILKLIRPNILNLKPYSSARDEYKGKEAVFLDANENPFNSGLNRYPDPLQRELKDKIAKIKPVATDQIFLGNGSDEAIDVLYRIFCEPGVDNIITINPSYGMYTVCADINNIAIKSVSLTTDFQLDVNATLSLADAQSKLLFLCSPNNPSGNILKRSDIIALIEKFNGIVVLDEAYIDFADEPSFLIDLKKYPNLVVLQTFSKAWGLAGIRLGMAMAHPTIIGYMNKVKYPYNVNILTQRTAIETIENVDYYIQCVKEIISQREWLACELAKLSYVQKIYPSDANFVLVKMDNPLKTYEYLVDNKVIVRDRSKVHLCEGCLRITVGTVSENSFLMNCLSKYN